MWHWYHNVCGKNSFSLTSCVAPFSFYFALKMWKRQQILHSCDLLSQFNEQYSMNYFSELHSESLVSLLRSLLMSLSWLQGCLNTFSSPFFTCNLYLTSLSVKMLLKYKSVHAYITGEFCHVSFCVKVIEIPTTVSFSPSPIMFWVW